MGLVAGACVPPSAAKLNESGRRAGPRTGSRGRGFTLLEILLAVALLGLLSAALVSGAIQLVDDQPKTPEDVFWAASTAARRGALKHEREVLLTYDTKDKRFVVTDGPEEKAFPVRNARDLTVDLLPGQEGRGGTGTILLGGQLAETGSLSRVTYYPDGTCTPFRVQFRAQGPVRLIAIDPWTCAPVLRRNPDNP